MSFNSEHPPRRSVPLGPPPWLAWQAGQRVSVLFRLDDGLHEAVGLLVSSAPDHVRLATRSGEVHIDAWTLVSGRTLPPLTSGRDVDGQQS